MAFIPVGKLMYNMYCILKKCYIRRTLQKYGLTMPAGLFIFWWKYFITFADDNSRALSILNLLQLAIQRQLVTGIKHLLKPVQNCLQAKSHFNCPFPGTFNTIQWRYVRFDVQNGCAFKSIGSWDVKDVVFYFIKFHDSKAYRIRPSSGAGGKQSKNNLITWAWWPCRGAPAFYFTEMV